MPYPESSLFSCGYVDYFDKNKSLAIKKDAIPAGSKVLIADEWIETGGSVRCCIELLHQTGCKVAGLATIGIDYREATKDWIHSGFVAFVGMNI